MNAWLAKALDRWTIRQATRSLERHTAPACLSLAVPSDTQVATLLKKDAVYPSDWSWGANGGFAFTSSVRTESAANNLVWGKFYPAAERWHPLPTAVLLHGWNAEICYRHQFPYLATLLRRAGINTAVLELPYHMRRRPREGPVRDFISSDLPGMLEATAQAVADTRGLCQWLERQGSTALGLWGFSLGAWLAGLIARLERKLRFVVLTTPITRIDRVIADLPFCAHIRRGLENRQVDLRPLNLGAHLPVVERERILLVASQYDMFSPAETVEELWRAWGRPEIWRPSHGHISLLLSAPLMKRTVSWMRQRITSLR